MASTKSAETRKANAEARFQAALADFRAYAKGKEWVASDEIHTQFPLSSDGMYGRIKQALAIPHRRAKDAAGKTQYQWDLSKVKAS